MKKISVLLLLLCLEIGLVAQVKKEELNTNAAGPTQPAYSESVPYEPRYAKAGASASDKDNKKKKTSEIANLASPQGLPPDGTSEQPVLELPIYVLDKNGVPVTDLRKDELTLFINDTEQEIELVEARNASFNIILLLDNSNSATFEGLEKITTFATSMVGTLSPQNRIKIISFDGAMKTLSPFTQDMEILSKALRKMKSGDGTSLYDTIPLVLKKEVEAPTLIIILTDGVDTTSRKETFASSLVAVETGSAVVFPIYLDTFDIQSTKRNKSPEPSSTAEVLGRILQRKIQLTNVIGVSAASKADIEMGKNYLIDLAAITGGRVFETKTLSDVPASAFDIISRMIRPQYYLRSAPLTAAAGKRRLRIKLRVNRSNLYVQTRGSQIIPQEPVK